MTEIIELDESTIQDAYAGWYYTILGQGGDLNEWTEGYQNNLADGDIGTVEQWYHTTGGVINRTYGLSGDVAFADDLSVLMFAYDGMDVRKLAMFKIAWGDRWFTDIIDNSIRRCHPEQPNDDEEVEE